jgi:hypothetical protein
MTEYLIWSNEHLAWWKPAELGYTTITHNAGRYSKEEADAICARANFDPETINEGAVLARYTTSTNSEMQLTYDGLIKLGGSMIKVSE